MSDGKNQLVGLSHNQEHPHEAKASDFKPSAVTPGHGQGGGVGTAEGQNQLATQSEYQESPRCNEDEGKGPHGSGTPVGSRSGVSGFKIGKQPNNAPRVSGRESVNLATGKHDS